MTRYLTRPTALIAAFSLIAVAACSDDDRGTPGDPKRVLTSISISVPVVSLELGQSITAVAVGLDQDGAPLTIGQVIWSSDEPTVAAVHPTSGVISGVGLGSTRVVATFEGKTGERVVTVAPSPAIRINEVQPRPGSPTGWVEFFNPTSAAVDLANWSLVGNDFFNPVFKFPAGSVIPPNGFLVVEETMLGFNLEAPDNLYLISRFGAVVDAVIVGPQPATTYGRCPDGAAPFTATTAATKGSANSCP